MNKTQFTEMLLEALRNDEELSDLEFHNEHFHNTTTEYDAILATGRNPVPVINIDKFYDEALTYGFEDVIKDCVDGYKQQIADAARFLSIKDRIANDYNGIKDNLFIRLTNEEDNAEYLKNVPHRIPVEGIAITYHILVEDSGNSISSAIINNKMMENWGISEETLHDDAVASGMKLFEPVFKDIGTMPGITGVVPVPGSTNIAYCLTNNKCTNGAAVLFYPGEMEEIASSLGGSFYVMPSSIHEFVIKPASENDKMKEEDMKKMIAAINSGMILTETPEV